MELPCRAELTRQHGWPRAAVVTAVVDSACGCAVLALTAAGAGERHAAATLATVIAAPRS